MTGLTRLFVHEWKLYVRDAGSAIFGFIFPPALLVIFGLIPMFGEPDPNLGGLRLFDLYVPIMIAVALATVAINTLPAAMAAYRERGILRKLSTTPVSPLTLLGAQLLVNLAVGLASILVMMLLARLVFDVAMPNPVALAISTVVLAPALFGIGLVISALSPSAKFASGVSTIIYFPIMFFAGLWLPRETMPDILRTISDLTPIGAGVQALQNSFTGDWPSLASLGVMTAYAVVLTGIAAKTFRWN
ncbi:ABC transporter permease [Actinoalloteichus hymeniacidonis]|uniref:Transport permease protein n=1 Tax=Actinoalloteichus hymeniacidonis TaxID=340345 RepID=A0AAC9HTE7_9PSEU|nr:ABC transporter permease [Actinoalloteichus hymeniacidonis]AOS65050.1 ABC-2 type transporter [Actinoalloteichus hymeniacidonis]MBB5906871.1 ABC-2 type transport system permease protein [Actinoalloteichus hymeniacidonis]